MHDIQHSHPTTTPVVKLSGVSLAANSSMAAISTSLAAGNVPTPVNNTCPDVACASVCSFSWASWSSSSADWLSAHADVASTSTIVSFYATTSYTYAIASSGTPYATCNAYPRYIIHLGNASFVSSNADLPATSTTRYLLSTRTRDNYTVPIPAREISAEQCYNLQHDWHKDHYLPFPFNESTG